MVRCEKIAAITDKSRGRPIKRRAGVTAGIARGAEAEGISSGHRRSDDNNEVMYYSFLAISAYVL